VLGVCLVVLAVLWIIQGAQFRTRLAALPAVPSGLPDSDTPPGYRLLAAPGVSLSDAGLRAAAAHARAGGIDLLDLVPVRASAWRLLRFAQGMAPAQRDDIFARFASAGYALLVSSALLDRTERAWPIRSPADIAIAATRLRRIAGKRVGWAISDALAVPRAGQPGDSSADRLALLTAGTGALTGSALLAVALAYAFGLAAPLLALRPGLLLLGAMHLQPLLALAGTRLRPRDLPLFALLRAPLEILGALRIALAWRPGREPEEITARRADYATADPTAFFEPRRDRCPLCDAAALEPRMAASDIVHAKPGRFHLDRCTACGHVFQNPRLSLAGLDYYYRDVYDGVFTDRQDRLFGLQRGIHVGRAAAVAAVTEPRRWLDVGGGHGHFCAVARQRFPTTRFEALDLSEGILEAARRGWIDRGHRGLFPVLAPALADAADPIDVVSMHHYLEHTLDPVAEIAAAHQVLAPRGILVIEVPDPESRLGSLLRGHWFSWLQPQHLHFVSVANLEALLRRHGFEPLTCQRGEAHIAGDLTAMALILLQRLAPDPRVPWRPAPSVLHFVWYNIAWVTLAPTLAITGLIDLLTTPFLRRPRWSNTYRLIARKQAAGDDGQREAPTAREKSRPAAA
jgi:ubiquinone/menaquinone biosynthesis C-methylase UbiE